MSDRATRTPRKIHYHYHRPGRSVTVYDEWLVVDRPDAKVLLLESYEGKTVRVGDDVVLDRGAPIVWYVFPGAWHDVGRFHRADGAFMGWYTNLTRPVEFTAPTQWAATDLFLDLWTPATGPSRWLDEDELARAVADGVLDSETVRRIGAERAAIEQALLRGVWPPAIAREVDLAQARSLR